MQLLQQLPDGRRHRRVLGVMEVQPKSTPAFPGFHLAEQRLDAQPEMGKAVVDRIEPARDTRFDEGALGEAP